MENTRKFRKNIYSREKLKLKRVIYLQSESLVSDSTKSSE